MSRTSGFFHRKGISVLAVIVIFGSVLLWGAVPAVFAQDQDISLTLRGPSYVTPGSNITYELTLENLQSQPITDITVWNPLPVDTTYVSGGVPLRR